MKDSRIDPRHTARVLALQQLFNYFSPAKADSASDSFSNGELMEMYEQAEYNSDLYEAIVSGVKANQELIDKVVQQLAPLWPLSQVSLTDLVILRISIWECFIAKRVPEKVGIDEAIELAKEFAGNVSATFVNGVLGNLLKNQELQAELAHAAKQ